MSDFLTPQQRSERMSRIRSKDTKPELFVRRAVWVAGFRYRLHKKELPGHPDLVFSSLGTVVFVHGCYWHGHTCQGGGAYHTAIAPSGPRSSLQTRSGIAGIEINSNGWAGMSTRYGNAPFPLLPNAALRLNGCLRISNLAKNQRNTKTNQSPRGSQSGKTATWIQRTP